MEQLLKTTVDAVVDFSYPEMSVEARHLLAIALIRYDFPKGHTLLKQGDVARSIVFVAKGMMRRYYFKEGRDLSEHFAYEGQPLFAIESFFNQSPSRLIIETLEDAVVYRLPFEKLQRLTHDNWELNLFYRKMLERALVIAQEKADSWRFENVSERYIRLARTHPEILKRVPQKYIASYLLMTPETLSRVRSEVRHILQAEGYSC
jgi:CRP-like cAMP-binding protein